jgi:hypothetical protein
MFNSIQNNFKMLIKGIELALACIKAYCKVAEIKQVVLL